jgi:hypothetical protein
MLNNISCTTEGGNTGYGSCFLNPKNIVGGFIVPKDFELATADLATSAATIAKLEAGTLLAAASRVYPLPRFENLTDNTEEATLQTLGYGGLHKTREGRYNWTYQFVDGGLCLSNALRKFNGKKVYVIFFDADGLVVGQKVGTSIKGIPMTLFDAKPFKLNDGSNVAAYNVQFIFEALYINENIGFSAAEVADLVDIQGLQNIVLTAGTRSTNVLKATAKYGCDGEDVYDLYSTELAVVTAWVAKTPAGVVLDITSVAVDANISGWTITLDAADPDYTVGVDVSLSLGTPAVLDGLGVSGFESNTIVIE